MYEDFIIDKFNRSDSLNNLARRYLIYFLKLVKEGDAFDSKEYFFNKKIDSFNKTIKEQGIYAHEKIEKALFVGTDTSPISVEDQAKFEKSYSFHKLDDAMRYRGLKLKNPIYRLSSMYSGEWLHMPYVFRKPELNRMIDALKLAKENTVEELEEGYINEWYSIIKDSFYKDGINNPKGYMSRYFDRNRGDIGGTKEEFWVTIEEHIADMIKVFEILANDNNNSQIIEEYQNLIYHFVVNKTGENGYPNIYEKYKFSQIYNNISVSSLAFVVKDKTYVKYKDFIKLKQSVSGKSEVEERIDKVKEGKIPAKFYALYHHVLIEMKQVKPFEKSNDKLPKSKIEEYAESKYRDVSSQVFYTEFRDLDFDKKEEFTKIFGTDYKNKLIKISNDDSSFTAHIKSYPG